MCADLAPDEMSSSMSARDLAIHGVAAFLRTSVCGGLLRAFFRTPTFVITTNPGAFLGNQLTIFAHVIASACETGRHVWGPSFFLYARYFTSPSRDICTRFPERRSLFRFQRLRMLLYYYVFARLVRVVILKPDTRQKDLIVLTDYERPQSLHSPATLSRIDGKRVVFLEGYFFRTSMAAVREHSRVIKEYFKPLPRHEANAAAVVQQARTRGRVLVGVHLRQFDAVIDHTPHPLYKYQHAREMNQAMRRTADSFPGKTVVFLLCSNREVDPRGFADFCTAAGTGHIAEDLHALCLCDYILASTYSTYSRWASFYGDVPLYQVDAPTAKFSLQDFRVQVPGFYDPANELCEVQV